VVNALTLDTVVLKINNLVLVDGTMTETALVSGLVDNHGIFHIVTSVRNDSNDGVSTHGVLVEEVLLVRALVTNDGNLRILDTVDLVINTVRVGVVRSTHGLLTHLALIHVTGRLVVVGEGSERGNHGEDIRGRNFLMRRETGLEILRQASDFHSELLKSADVLNEGLVDSDSGEVVHRADEAGAGGGEGDRGPHTVGVISDGEDFEVLIESGVSRDLHVTDTSSEGVGLGLGHATDEDTIEEDGNIVAGGGESGISHAEVEEDVEELLLRDVAVVGQETARSREVVKKTARRTIRSVDRAHETP